MDTITQAEVDNSESTGERQGWLWTTLTQDAHPFTLSTGKNHA